MQFILRIFITVITLLLLPLVALQLFLSDGGNVQVLDFSLMVLLHPLGFAPLAVGIIILAGLHHSALAPQKKRLFGILTVSVLIVLRLISLFVWGDGSWGSLYLTIAGSIELFCYLIIALLFRMMNRIAEEKRDTVRLIVFVVVSAIFALQLIGPLRLGLIG